MSENILELKDVKQLITNLKHDYNDFTNEIDRKYALYSIFRYAYRSNGFHCERLIGSNQIILTYQYNKDTIKTLYDSDNENDLKNPKTFTVKLESYINQYLMNRDNNNALRVELEATKDKHVPNYDPVNLKFIP